MEKLLEYKRILRLKAKVEESIKNPNEADLDELKHQLEDINDALKVLESESEYVRKFIASQETHEKEEAVVKTSEVPETKDQSQVPSHTTVKNVQQNNGCAAMSIFFVCTILCMVFGTMVYQSCEESRKEKEAAEEYAREHTPEKIAERRKQDSIYQVQKHIQDSIKLASRVQEVKNSIKITSYYLQSPNSAGGCNLRIAYKNMSKKTIKYAIFNTHFMNAVGDYVNCEIKGAQTFRAQDTGPVKPGRSTGLLNWDSAIYNYSAKKPILESVEIEYTDGSKITISKDELKYIR